MDKKQFEELSKIQSLHGMDKWYSWNSPIGLSIFFFVGTINITILSMLIKFLFFAR